MLVYFARRKNVATEQEGNGKGNTTLLAICQLWKLLNG